MNYTVKVREEHSRRDSDGLPDVIDLTEFYFPADNVSVGMCDEPGKLIDDWFRQGTAVNDCRNWVEIDNTSHGERVYAVARLIALGRGVDPTVWILASQAWLLGPDGRTIERIAP